MIRSLIANPQTNAMQYKVLGPKINISWDLIVRALFLSWSASLFAFHGDDEDEASVCVRH